ncbi:MAG: type II secretion system F family protein [Steroidobacteraceae bacterium]
MHFKAKTLSADNGVLICPVEAVDEADARRQLGDRGLKVITMSARRSWRRSRAARIPLVNFTQELVALLDAGLSLTESIDTLSEKEAVPSVKRALDQIRNRLFEGQTLSACMSEMPASFPPLYVATVRASERTGAIREALNRYVAYQQQVDVLRKSLVNASIYPAVLTLAGTLVTVFLMWYVVPRFSGIYEDLGSDLPFASRMLMQWGQLLQAHGMTILVVLTTAAGLLAYILSRPKTRIAIGGWIASIPAFGAQLRLYQLARLYRTLGMLLRGGTPAVTALEMSAGLLNASMRTALADATRAVREGQSIANSLQSHALTTHVAARMLRVGERGGNMGEMMERIAAFYDDELGRWVQLMTRLIEPALMTVIGLIIGVIVVLMYFPIFELAGSIR